jgi:hypothetical protein
MDKAAIAALANAIQIINRVGTSADGSGIATLFGKLAAVLADTALIKGYTDQVEGYVDSLESLVGTASPASGDLTTLFRGLKLIVDYVDTLETKIGLNNDAAGTTTLFARLAQIAGYTDQVEGYVDTVEAGLITVLADLVTVKGYTDTLETNVGSNADASSATGSAHAKLKDVKAAVGLIKALPTGAAQWGGFGTSAQPNTALNISGSGWLYAVCAGGSYDSGQVISIQIDGGTVRSSGSPSWAFMPVRFASSLLVKGSVATSAIVVAVLD